MIYPMIIRKAQVQDVKAINALIANYAEHDRMLFRSVASIFETLQAFTVAEDEAQVVGCCAVEVIWSDLAEVKSLAVKPGQQGKGVGRLLVEEAVTQARNLGVPRLFALTLEPEFFAKLGFEEVDMAGLPMKVWSDCARCPKQDHCDEIAMIRVIESVR